MVSERLKKTILTELKLDDYNFTAQTAASDVPGWDSLNHINVIIAVEKEYKIRFKNTEILRLRTVAELQDLIDSRNLT